MEDLKEEEEEGSEVQEARVFTPPSTSTSTPLPRAQMVAVCLSLFCDAYSVTSLFPYVAFMVLDFGLVSSISAAGYYAGFLSGARGLAKVAGSLLWGPLLDSFGRRPVILGSLIGTFLSSILFGFSRNFTWALIARFLTGLLSGNAVAARVYLGEITDPSNRAKGMGFVPLIWGVGRIISPLFGGLLARPALQYPRFFSGQFYREYPYFLPNAFGALFTLISFFVSYKYLPETPVFLALKRKMKAKRKRTRKSKFSLREIFKRDQVFLLVWVYFLIGSAFFITDELFPLWASKPISEGGLSFTTKVVGIALSLGGLSRIVSQIPFVKLSKVYGYISLIRYGLIVCTLLSLLPFINTFYSWKSANPRTIESLVWFSIAIYFILRGLVGSLVFSSLYVINNNVVENKILGRVTGITMAAGSLSISIAPALATIIFAWSSNNGKEIPLDQTLIFWINGILFLIAAKLSFSFKKSLDKPKEEEEEEEEEEELKEREEEEEKESLLKKREEEFDLELDLDVEEKEGDPFEIKVEEEEDEEKEEEEERRSLDSR